MSAAIARRRKQLLARKKEEEDRLEGQDPVRAKLLKLLEDEDGKLSEEATAYEALQLAQSQIRKKVHSGDFSNAVDLSYTSSLAILKKGRVSVASQLLTVLTEVLRETHTEETKDLIDKIAELHEEHCKAMEGATGVEAIRLQRLQRDWLRRCVQWSSELGKTKYGSFRLHELLGQQSWMLSKISKDQEEEEEIRELQSDAVVHMSLAEKPLLIVDWLKELPGPTDEQTKTGHVCAPADRDALLTRSLLCLCAMENLRDANALLRAFIAQVEERDINELTKSYVSKDDGKSPSHVIFGCMLVRICEKDTRTGPLFSWLLRSFKRELDLLHKPQVIHSYTVKIGKVFFNIQPPPSMLNMMENMMGMMGGGGAGGGMNPAMMQAALSQMGGM